LGPTLCKLCRMLASLALAGRALEAHDAEAVSVLGLLALSAALAAAVLARSSVADQWLTRASELAAQVPSPMFGNWQSFCPANVTIWRIALAVERGDDGRKVARLAQLADERDITSRSRYAAFLVDIGRGLARDDSSLAEAIGWLSRAENTAPQLVRNSPAAIETVGYLLVRARATAGAELRDMADRMGVPVKCMSLPRGRLACGGRRLQLRLAASWPWSQAITTAIAPGCCATRPARFAGMHLTGGPGALVDARALRRAQPERWSLQQRGCGVQFPGCADDLVGRDAVGVGIRDCDVGAGSPG